MRCLYTRIGNYLMAELLLNVYDRQRIRYLYARIGNSFNGGILLNVLVNNACVVSTRGLEIHLIAEL